MNYCCGGEVSSELKLTFSGDQPETDQVSRDRSSVQRQTDQVSRDIKCPETYQVSRDRQIKCPETSSVQRQTDRVQRQTGQVSRDRQIKCPETDRSCPETDQVSRDRQIKCPETDRSSVQRQTDQVSRDTGQVSRETEVKCPKIGRVVVAEMSSKVQPSDTKVHHTVGPDTKVLLNSKGKNLHCSYWTPHDSQNIRGLVFLCQACEHFSLRPLPPPQLRITGLRSRPRGSREVRGHTRLR
ncbi:hypothetical protein OTU49_010058 [Cherax quadricarinatus]|uniref:Uncharacterized protein n=1 Tax=Cherax quadricarinatus TaxID=27406 RepID=A0AAW0WKR3_CHEQU